MTTRRKGEPNMEPTNENTNQNPADKPVNNQSGRSNDQPGSQDCLMTRHRASLDHLDRGRSRAQEEVRRLSLVVDAEAVRTTATKMVTKNQPRMATVTVVSAVAAVTVLVAKARATKKPSPAAAYHVARADRLSALRSGSRWMPRKC